MRRLHLEYKSHDSQREKASKTFYFPSSNEIIEAGIAIAMATKKRRDFNLIEKLSFCFLYVHLGL
ncbi:MAG: hypothetical protein ACJAZC_001932 [Cryomorphaceae bacterium]|jgi:hypothetical protein